MLFFSNWQGKKSLLRLLKRLNKVHGTPKQKIDNICLKQRLFNQQPLQKTTIYLDSFARSILLPMTSIAQNETRVAVENRGKRWQVIQSAQCAVDTDILCTVEKKISWPCISRLKRKVHICQFILYPSFQYLKHFQYLEEKILELTHI